MYNIKFTIQASTPSTCCLASIIARISIYYEAARVINYGTHNDYIMSLKFQRRHSNQIITRNILVHNFPNLTLTSKYKNIKKVSGKPKHI